ncbi:alpha/beta fold hydrolase [Pseudomonas putida]|nr:alpha/beta fold hydrolase [Pseudomonas putida]
MRRREFVWASSVLTVLLMSMCAWASARTNDVRDPYYHVDTEELEAGQHGRLIKFRSIEAPAGLEGAESNRLMIYKSNRNDASETPIAVSAIVAIPHGPTPVDGWPIISWAHGTVGSADKCAPSMDNQLIADSDALRLHKVINHAPHLMLNEFLSAGWAVVMTDYEGLGTAGAHPYLNGESEARSILDAVQAAHELKYDNHEGSIFSKRFAIVGHSQGGQAALFAAHYQPVWAPALDLVGAAAIAPASKLEVLQSLPGASLINPDLRANFPFLALAIEGVRRGKADLDMSKFFTETGLKLYSETADVLCRTELSESRWVEQGEALFSKPILVELAAQLRAMHPDLKISVPVRISQAEKDRRVDVGFTRDLKDQLKKTNPGGPAGQICYKEYSHVEQADDERLGDHFGILKDDREPIKAWLAKRFESASDLCPEE